ncbi:MAG: type II toxin-antitoxin system VapC family toxin [Halieaceae bacterium]|jgi:tRNA(fMet)-specific endonuclease VapC|nr:type II toxin-antitoxin system VapC family toxin [Halieaceae bacterium]
MQCMLDTDTCVYLIKKAPGLKPQSALEDCYISTIVLGELEYGVANSSEARREQNRQALLDFISAVQILPLTESVSETYGQLRATLKKQPIGPNDTWIAAHALAMQLPLVTNNTREFSRVPELVIDTWVALD